MKNPKNTFLRTEARDAWIMMAPALFVLCAISLYPVLRTFWLSLHEMVLTKPATGFPFIGLQNYQRLFADKRALDSIWFTLRFTVVTVFFELLVGFAAAMIMNQKFRGRGLVRAAVLIPWAIPTSVSALMWKFIYNDQYGLFNDILYRLGVIGKYHAWLANANDAFMALVITDTWKTAPYVALLILAGLQMIPEEMYEAAKIDGAGALQRFFRITLPVVRNTVLVTLLFRTLDAFRVFDLVFVMTGGANRTESVSIYAYTNLMRFLDFGYGSALSVLIFAVVFLISLAYMRLLGDKLTDL